MSGLILKLRPHEQLLVNGVIIENGERKARLRIKSEDARVLRLRDAMRPEEATTPVKHAYYIAQCAVAGEITEQEAQAILETALADFAQKFTSKPESESVASAVFHLDHSQFYLVMRHLRDVVAADESASGAKPAPEPQSIS